MTTENDELLEDVVAKVNLFGVRGDTFERDVAIKDEAGAAIDITGWIFSLTIKRQLDDDADDSSASGADGAKADFADHDDPTHGLTKMVLTADDCDELSGEYQYDYQATKPDGSKKTVMMGKITFVDDATRRTVE